jgi:SMI1 / KNR4 family (SUKH-1)
VDVEEGIQAAESRLGLRLPPSYRRHLLDTGDLPGDHGLTLLPIDQIDRFGRREPEWLAGWLEGYESGAAMHGPGESLRDDPGDPATMRVDQLADTIVISTIVDERVLLINPAAIDQGREWEAWDFANWYPGAYRYPSFARLVETLASGG